tara:strand:+ start:5966 stop:6394 length:429 start_codon:yes stop_codon:yes gene_type:complete
LFLFSHLNIKCRLTTYFVNNLQLQYSTTNFNLATLIVNNLHFMEEKDPITEDLEFLHKLIMGIGEVAEVTGIPTRQIRYWEEKGYISSLSEQGRNRRYNYMNIKKMLLIKEMLDEGYTLEASVAKVEKRTKLVNEALEKFKK